ncbi:MAG: nucleotide exchange factor GrpE [Thermoanaerobaculum sp.]|nr:nucleotide exchange factor GrpE [Thermoanaerobaculum sp.]
MTEREEKGLEVPATGEETGDAVNREAAPTAGPEAPEAEDQALQEELLRMQQELERFRELYLRKLADFDNFRKRKEKEMEEFRKTAHADVLRDILPVLDNLERALAVPEGDGSGIRTGVELVLRQLKDVLARYGLSEVNPLDHAFDPRVHEAIGRQERADLQEERVVEVLQKGYMLGEKLLRPALVVVGVPVRQEEQETGTGGELAQGEDSEGEPWVS